MVKDVICALATPFKNDKIDFASLRRLLILQENGGIKTLLVLGTTSQSPLLTQNEREDVIRFVKNNTSCNLLCGVESPSTAQCLKSIEAYTKLGVNSFVAVTPFFSKATQQGVILHYTALARACDCLYLYNVPLRTSFDLSLQICQKLSAVKAVKGIKDASNNVERAVFLSGLSNFDLFCGNDGTSLAYKGIGAKGVFSVACNAYPQLLQKAWAGNSQANRTLCTLSSLLFSEVSPVAVNYLLYITGVFDSPKVRLPLTPPTKKLQSKLMRFYETQKRSTL